MVLEFTVDEEILKSQNPKLLNDAAGRYFEKMNEITKILTPCKDRDRAYIAYTNIANFLQTKAVYFQNEELLNRLKEKDY